MGKRIIDILGSAFGLVVWLPAFVVIGVWIKFSSPGPVFYRGVRVGRGLIPFRIYKFRTMVVDAEKLGGPSTADDDPRVTKAGRFLRKYKLDELPQLINVLKGEMSLVGPRPEVPAEIAEYSEEEKELFRVRPGITDYASIRFHNEGELLKGSLDPHATYREKIRPEKIRLALQYARESSVRTDLKILLDTFRMLLITRSK